MKKSIIATAGLLLLAGTALAFKPTHTKATETWPIIAQVENHEQRIGDLEVKTDKTQTQVNQNTADIDAVATQTGTTKAQPVAPVNTPVAQPSAGTQASAPVAEPIPEPTPDPRTILEVTDEPNQYTPGLRTCTYKLYDKRQNDHQGPVNQPDHIPCHKVGEILPRY